MKKKISTCSISLLLAVIMLFSLCIPTSAYTTATYTITGQNVIPVGTGKLWNLSYNRYTAKGSLEGIYTGYSTKLKVGVHYMVETSQNTWEGVDAWSNDVTSSNGSIIYATKYVSSSVVLCQSWEIFAIAYYQVNTSYIGKKSVMKDWDFS